MNAQPSVSIETITPAIAAEMLVRNTHNRALNKHTVNLYADAMRRGEWDGHSQIVFSHDGVLLDGQHRLAAVAASGVTITVVVLRGIEAEAQETIDTGKKRSFGDVLTLRGESNATALAAAVKFVHRAETNNLRFNRPFTNKQLLDTLERHSGIRDYTSFPGLKTLRVLGCGIPSSVACGLRYLFGVIDDDDAEAFFASLVSGVGLAAGSPILALRHRLEVAKSGGHRQVSPTLVAAWVIKAWNAWRAGKQIHKLQWKLGGANPEPFPEIDGLAAALAEMRGAA